MKSSNLPKSITSQLKKSENPLARAQVQDFYKVGKCMCLKIGFCYSEIMNLIMQVARVLISILLA